MEALEMIDRRNMAWHDVWFKLVEHDYADNVGKLAAFKARGERFIQQLHDGALPDVAELASYCAEYTRVCLGAVKSIHEVVQALADGLASGALP